MSFFKNLFKREETQPPPRQLEHPKDLQPGDIIKFGFTSQTDISNETFRVKSIKTYDLGGDGKKKTVFTIESGKSVFELAIVDERGEEFLEVSRPVLPETVEQIFDIRKFAHIFDQDSGVNHLLERIGEPDHIAGWTAPLYRQEMGHQAYLHAGDYRERVLSRLADGCEGFDYYLLVSDDRRFSIQIEVYDGGRTEVKLTIYLEISKIEELWPSLNSK